MRWTAYGATPWLLSATLFSALFSGCVSVEKYEVAKSRALNFQRLLVQEENRAGEINAQLQKAKIEIASLESQKHDLTVDLDSLREEQNLQEEQSLQQPNDPSTGSAVPSGNDIGEQPDRSFSESSLSEFGLNDLSFDESDFTDLLGGDAEEPIYHTVNAGETLYRISRNYGVTIAQLKEWNNLTGNLISIGQRLIVSTP